ncbi:hypothetical protein V8G54_031812 [Vigna mungo]|uniref:Uncharacterized protein n=1 Tax=Vigna mungo TaxID=3915 RepID=A0AAQ3MK11_VIGMU
MLLWVLSLVPIVARIVTMNRFASRNMDFLLTKILLVRRFAPIVAKLDIPLKYATGNMFPLGHKLHNGKSFMTTNQDTKNDGPAEANNREYQALMALIKPFTDI